MPLLFSPTNFLVLFLALGAAFFLVSSRSHQPLELVEIRFESGEIVRVDVARSFKDQRKGLSGRDELYPYKGMLFIYDDTAIRHFWMKDMAFPIDIIWLKSEAPSFARVVGIEEAVPAPKTPMESPARRASPVPVDLVLELSSGSSQALGLSLGQSVQMIDGF